MPVFYFCLAGWRPGNPGLHSSVAPQPHQFASKNNSTESLELQAHNVTQLLLSVLLCLIIIGYVLLKHWKVIKRKKGKIFFQVALCPCCRTVIFTYSRNRVMYSLLHRDQVSGEGSYWSCRDMIYGCLPTDSQSFSFPSCWIPKLGDKQAGARYNL